MESQEKKCEQRKQLASDVATFLANGGEIKQAHVTDNKWWRDAQKGKRKRTNAEAHAERNQADYQRTADRRAGQHTNAGHSWRTQPIAQ